MTNNCPICLDIIKYNSGYIELSCCNKPTHLYCINEWYKINPTDSCFLCNQLNDTYNIFL